jgi:hypothetical protein
MFRSILFAVVVLLSSSLVLAQDPPRQWGPNGVGIDFFGHSGAFVLWTIDGAHWVKVKFQKLQEVDIAGNVVAQARNFADFDFLWNRPRETVIWGVNVTEVKLVNSALEVDTKAGNQFLVNFQVDTFIFNATTTGQFAGETINVKAGQLKWQLTVQQWQFQNVNNTLRYAVQLISDQFANNTAYQRLDHVPGTVSSFAIAFGKADLIVPQVATVDNKTVAIKATVLYEAGQLQVQWDFPSFTTAGAGLLYDPVTATSDLVLAYTSGAAGKSVSVVALLVTMLAAVCSMLR